MNHRLNHQASLEEENARLRGDLLTLAKRISHDLRTPLGGIAITAEALKEVLAARDPSAVSLAESLLASTDEIEQLIKQVSFVARASASPQSISAVPMAEAVSPALQRLESRILKCHAAIVEPPSWPVVPGVVSWLEAIWWHLLQNALKYGGQNTRIELGWAKQNGATRFWVSDNGPGVPEDLRGKLFREFHCLYQDQGATGLGLSIVQRLVDLQGGHCGYEQPATGGSCFFFTLPQ